MSSLLDKAIEAFAPETALRRQTARRMLTMQRAYEAAQPSRLRKIKTDHGSGDSIVERAGESLRLQARYLDENHDLARGILNVLVNNVVGRGITIEPQVKLKNGALAKKANDQLIELWEEWIRKPEVTWELGWNQMLRLLARCWLRDGEVLVKHIEGTSRSINHGTVVPYSVELIEADFLPLELSDESKGIVHGVQKNQWRTPVAYYLYPTHPGDMRGSITRLSDMKRIPAERILHLKLFDRIGQTRGVSLFASVLERMEDIKDYELSERIAAKVAASMCAFIRKNVDGAMSSATNEHGDRPTKMKPGIIFDNLLPGEEIGMIDSNRPNNNLEHFRSGQLRAIAAGTCTSFSSISKNYNGTYSAQRQELVEQSIHYTVMRDYFIERCVRPIWERFVTMAMASGALELPSNRIQPMSITKAGFQGPTMPWIDPQKEVTAEEKAVQAGFKSRSQVIRERGGNPQDVFEQLKQEREQDNAAEMSFTSTAGNPASPPKPDEPEKDESDEQSDQGS